MSLPWRRPKSALVHDDMRNLPQQLSDMAIDDDVAVEEQPYPRRMSHGQSPSSANGIRRYFRRASLSLRGMVHRGPSGAEDIYEEQEHEHEHGPARPFTSHPAWTMTTPPHHQRDVRPTRSFYGFDLTQEPLTIPQRASHTSYGLARPGAGGEPPIIPYSSGAAAKASAAMQNEFLARQGLQNRLLQPTTAMEDNDDESGVGIAVSVPGAKEAQISRLDFIAKLPAELAIHILGYLDAAALGKASLVCRRWKQVASNQHIWRESCLREMTGTYAMSGSVGQNVGLGLPKNLPGSDWRQIYRVGKQLDQMWKQGKARPMYLNGHTDSIYCLQFDEYVPIIHPRSPPLPLPSLIMCTRIANISPKAQDHHGIA